MENKHGIFISYKRTDKFLAGRVFDYFYHKGLDPFMDEHTMHQSKDFWETIVKEIKQTPYFLFILTKDSFEELKAPDINKKNYYKQELLTAIESKVRILILAFDFSPNLEELGEEFSAISKLNYYPLPNSNRLFKKVLDELYEKDIDLDMLVGILDWKEYSTINSNMLLKSRSFLEKRTASFEHRFGEDFVRAVEEKRDAPIDSCIVKEVNLVCYAGSLVFASDKGAIDYKAYDYGKMFNIFGELFKNKDFHLSMVINAPYSVASQDAIKYGKLGNGALKDDEEAVFYLSYGRINELFKREPYKSAYENKQFSLTITDCCLPYALFEIRYIDKYASYNHIKIDLYSFDIKTSVNRRTMIIFEDNDKDNYDFFKNQILMKAVDHAAIPGFKYSAI